MVPLAALTVFFLLLRCTSAVDPPADFPGDETPYRVIPTGTDVPQPTGDVEPDNISGTWLYKYLDCNKNFGDGAKKIIDDAYYDAWRISNTAGVASDIDWNNMAALEFLGPPGLNIAQKPQIQAVLANTATIIYSYINPWENYIKIRCDDPHRQCKHRPDDDACRTSKLNPGNPPRPKATPLAYATNSDPDDPDTPMINLCSGFFDRRSLADAITYGSGLRSPYKEKLSNYDNRAQTFLHNLYHLNLAADSPTNNPSVLDLKVDIKLAVQKSITIWAYGPFGAKVLARWQGQPGENSVGYYVQRNADNLAYYALAKYVMSKNGNVYPHLPIISYEIDGPPYPGLLAEFVKDGSDFYLNTTDDDLSTWDAVPGFNYPGCSDDLNGRELTPALTIDRFVSASAYPDDYNDQVSTWVKALGLSDGGSDPGVGRDAGQQIAIASYINPLGDQTSWEQLLAYEM